MNSIKPLVTLLIAMIIGFLSVGIVGYHTLKNSLIETKKEDVATILNIARSQSLLIIDQHKQGILSREQAEEKIVQFLSSLRYEAAYVWANDNHAIGRVHPREEIIGEFQSSYPNHMANLVDQDIFYLTKTNIKPVTDELIIKTNGVVKIPDWNWVIGFGLYMDDVHRSILKSGTLFLFSIFASILLGILVTYYWLRKAK